MIFSTLQHLVESAKAEFEKKVHYFIELTPLIGHWELQVSRN